MYCVMRGSSWVTGDSSGRQRIHFMTGTRYSARVELGGFEIALDTQLYLPREHSGYPTESTEYPPMLRRAHQGHEKCDPTEPMSRRSK